MARDVLGTPRRFLAGIFVFGAVGTGVELVLLGHLEGFWQWSLLALFWEALAGATPTLAPGTMVVPGLLGLACTYRHPALTVRHSERTSET